MPCTNASSNGHGSGKPAGCVGTEPREQPCSAHGDTGRGPGVLPQLVGFRSRQGTEDAARLLSSARG